MRSTHWYDQHVTGGEDYVSGPYTVTIPANMTTMSFDIRIINDTMNEDNQNFIVTIDSASLPVGFLVSDPYQATVTIVNDDDGKL